MIRGNVIGRYWATKRIEHIPSGAFLEVETEGGGRIMAFDVAATPALIVDGQVKAAGRVPSLDELKEMLQ